MQAQPGAQGQCVQAGNLRREGLDGRLDLRGVADIHRAEPGAPPGLPDALRGLFRPGEVPAVRDDHIRALPGKEPGRGGADAAGGAVDEDGFIAKLKIHTLFLGFYPKIKEMFAF